MEVMREVRESDHPKRKEVILKLSRLTKLATAGRYEDLPPVVRSFYAHFKYVDLVRPLVEIDRQKGLSAAVIARKYQLTERQVEYMICCKPKFVLMEEEE